MVEVIRALLVPSDASMLALPSLPLPSSQSGAQVRRRDKVVSLGRFTKQRRGVAVRASGMAESESAGGGTGGSGMVDANMMVLRKRIQSLRTQETFYDMPKEWMEWERNAYSSYRANICLLLSTIESQLLVMRPSVALSIVSLSLTILPVASLLFLTALGTQIWTLNCALLNLIPSSH